MVQVVVGNDDAAQVFQRKAMLAGGFFQRQA